MAFTRHFYIQRLLFVMAVLLTCSSCGLLETDPVSIPAYLYVPYVNFTTPGDGSQGDSMQQFADVWIFQKGKLLGNIGFPALIPVQQNGATELSFDAGILKSGQDNERISYPFTERVNVVHNLVPDQIDTVIPTFKYLSTTVFSINEGFDANGFQLTYSPNNTPGDTILKVKDNRALRPGRNSGMVVMASSSYKFELNSKDLSKETLQPFPGSEVYLELDYNSDFPINIGMYAQSPTGIVKAIPIFQTYASGGWKKVYISLSQDISPEPAGSKFKLALVIVNPDGVQPSVLLDNIKLVNF